MAELTENNSNMEEELDALQISNEIGVPVRTVQRWLATRPDIFPNARRVRPTKTAKYVTSRLDVAAYKTKYLKH